MKPRSPFRAALTAFAVALPLLAAVPARAEAAMSWQPTERFSVPGGDNPRVGIDPRGDVLLLWAERGAPPRSWREEGGRGRTGYSWRAPGGGWTKPGYLPGTAGPGYGDPIPMTARGEVTLAWTDDRDRLIVGSARPGESFQPDQVVSPPGEKVNGGTASVDDEGGAVVVWTGKGSGFVRAAVRAPGRSFGAPQTVATGGNGLADLAVNAAGAAAIVVPSAVNDDAQVAYRPPAGTFGPPEASPARVGISPQAAVLANGSAVIAGRPATAAYEAESRFATRSPLGEWGPELSLDPGGSLNQILAEPGGHLSFFTSSTLGPRGSTARFITRRRTGEIVGPTDLSRPNGCGGLGAMNGRGDILATWCEDYDEYVRGTSIAVAERPAGGSFGPPRRLATNAIFSFPALNDSGQAAVAWSRPSPSGDMNADAVEVAVREDPRGRLPFPPAVGVDAPADVSLGADGDLLLSMRCSEVCRARPAGKLYAGSARAKADGKGLARRIPARRRRQLKLRFGVSGAREARRALAAGRRPWVSFTITARGRSDRPVAVSRRVRLRR